VGGFRISWTIAALCLAIAGCGPSAAPETKEPPAAKSATTTVPTADLSAELPQVARGLIPQEAGASAEEELDVEQCGIAPVFPCVREYFVIERLNLNQRVELLRALARSEGWTIVSERRDGGVIIELARDSLRATYMVEEDVRADPIVCERTSLCLGGTMLSVGGPPVPLPGPSEVERARWTVEKATFVREADAICSEMLADAGRRPEALVEAFGNGHSKLAALDTPDGEEDDVERVLQPLRNLVRAARALTDEEGEDALPAAVAVGEFARLFNRAAAQYGLQACAAVG
jgi:hypothetical protein